MYTGIIEEIGYVRQNMPATGKISVYANTVLEDMEAGGSIAVNGVCLTVTDFDGASFTADVTPETLRRSALGGLTPGSPVNLERPVAANGRFGGHFVSGHIDGVGRIAKKVREGNAFLIEIETSPEILGLIVKKGSIAVDGISLTVASADPRKFTVSVIPHTGIVTALVKKKSGDTVNLETDLIGKYVRKFLYAAPRPQGLTAEFLQQNGF